MRLCPRCQESSLGPSDVVTGREACASCGGGFFAGDAALAFVEQQVGVPRDVLFGLSQQAAPGPLSCPLGHGAMLQVRLKGVGVDWCAGCGGLWLDASEASTLSKGAVFDGHARSPSSSSLLPSGAGAAPGRSSEDSAAMLEAFIGGARGYQIKGQFRWLEVLLGLEMANRYQVTAAGTGIGYAIETTSGILGLLARLLLGSHRPLEVDLFDPREQHVLTLTRPFYWFFSSMTVSDAAGRKRGEVHRRFAFFGKHYDLVDDAGRLFARVRSPFWRIWAFPIVDAAGKEVARVTKRWAGLGREMFTDADRFTVELVDRPFTLAQRAVLFAAALSIDLDFFENNHKR